MHTVILVLAGVALYILITVYVCRRDARIRRVQENLNVFPLFLKKMEDREKS